MAAPGRVATASAPTLRLRAALLAAIPDDDSAAAATRALLEESLLGISTEQRRSLQAELEATAARVLANVEARLFAGF